MSFLQFNCTKYPSSPLDKTPPSTLFDNTSASNYFSTPSLRASSLPTILSTTSTPIYNRFKELDKISYDISTLSLTSTSEMDIEASSLKSYKNLFADADSPCLIGVMSENQNIKMSISNVLRSASSVGETTCRLNGDLFPCMPKRADTFNGVSSKENNISFNFNELSKARMHNISTSNFFKISSNYSEL